MTDAAVRAAASGSGRGIPAYQALLAEDIAAPQELTHAEDVTAWLHPSRGARHDLVRRQLSHGHEPPLDQLDGLTARVAALPAVQL